MAKPRFLLGRGELLAAPIDAPKRNPGEKRVYSFDEALASARPTLAKMSEKLDLLSDELCPGDYAVARFTLNPSYIAKSYFPSKFFRETGIVALGSRDVRVLPRKWSKQKEPTECTTTSIFVTARRGAFRRLPEVLGGWDEGTKEAREFAQFETFSSYDASDKFKASENDQSEFFEVGLHLMRLDDEVFVLPSFMEFMESLGADVLTDLQFEAGNLWFVPVKISPERAPRIGEHAFVRVVRPMPKLRGLRPMIRSSDIALKVDLPDRNALSSEPRVAILDGGLPADHPIDPWLNRYQLGDATESSLQDGVEHGLGTASAFLFGPLKVGQVAPRPYANVTCIRVIDEATNQDDPMELYRTLGFIEEVLLSRQYQFINLSLGPDFPIEDDEVHVWTSVIDSLLEDGETLLTVAIGNNGESDRPSGNARVQVPSDAVNALAVGASDSQDPNNWKRAQYSAFGPGRRPGVVKPDVVAFGGSPDSYFHHLNPVGEPTISPTMGTSFSAPFCLRTAVGVRAILGPDIRPLAIKALLVHSADQNGHHLDEVGWGHVSRDISDIVNCPDGMVRIVYQGELKAGKYIRAIVPTPAGGIVGNVKLKATFCYACQTDPQYTSSYTRSGLEVTFRPDLEKRRDGSELPPSRTFFNMDKYSPEDERRHDYGKWETVIHDNDDMRGSTLKAPAFDIHYTARESGGATNSNASMQYALIITIEAPKHASLYNDVLEAYSEILVPIQPEVEVPISV